jgi:hypothetical protein
VVALTSFGAWSTLAPEEASGELARSLHGDRGRDGAVHGSVASGALAGEGDPSEELPVLLSVGPWSCRCRVLPECF